jgi:DNA-directed RNA polymerase specialized sigma24 family protein
LAQHSLTDERLQRLLASDVDQAWRAFVDAYTPMLVGLIERAGVRDHDEAMEVYTLVCERLTADRCGRLKRRDPSKGHMGAWLAVVVRHTIVDWVRQRAGRRRLFGAIQQMDVFHQQVFELYFWEERPLAEIAEELSVRSKERVTIERVLSAVDSIHGVLSPRHRSELLSSAMRAHAAVSLDADQEGGVIDPVDDRPGPEQVLARREANEAFDRALAALPPEDAAIVRLRYVQALSLSDVRRALHLPDLNERRIRGILDRLRELLIPAFGVRPGGLRPGARGDGA